MSSPTAAAPAVSAAAEPSPLAAGFAAARANFLPGLALIAVALVIVASYYKLPAATAALDHLAELKLRSGLLFAIASTALFGGVLPIVVQHLRPSRRAAGAWSALPFFTAFWAVKGIEVDMLYRMEAAVIGDNAQLSTVLGKVVFDQLIYCPIWAVPVTTLGYLWQSSGYDFAVMRQRLGRRWYARHVLPTLLANWFVWIPAVALIYSLKLPLQLPVQNIVLCLWAILMLFMTKPDTAAA